MKKLVTIIVFSMFVITLVVGCQAQQAERETQSGSETTQAEMAAGPLVLDITSLSK